MSRFDDEVKLANIIHSREKGKGSYDASSRQMCLRCSAHGDRFAMVQGRRVFFCSKHFHEWLDAAIKDNKILEE
jgi:hypothetical protein